MGTPVLKAGKRHDLLGAQGTWGRGRGLAPQQSPSSHPQRERGLAAVLRHTPRLRAGWPETPGNAEPGPRGLQLLLWLGHPLPPQPALAPLLPRSPKNGWCGHASYSINHDSGSQKDLESSPVALNKGLRPHHPQL